MSYEEVKRIVSASRNIVFFGGAGTSTESGIPDFRSEAGLYQTKTKHAYPPEAMLSRSFFTEHTEPFYEFYREKMIYKDARPNAAHFALARLEREGGLRAVITQNIDGLHQLAGSSRVLELHGSVHRNRCMSCAKFFGLDYIMASEDGVPVCDECGGTVKPEVVLYEERLDEAVLSKAAAFISEADVLIVGGTSLTVNPAAGLVGLYRGNNLILINKSSTPYDSRARFVIRDSIGEVLTSFC